VKETQARGSLLVVGTGIQCPAQLTLEARSAIEQADKLLFLVTEPITEHYLCELNSTGESLQRFYREGEDRFDTYMEMVDHVLGEVRSGKSVCVAFYGHPGIFVLPSHEAIKRAREEGFAARMLPGISAEDCLVADVGMDPGLPGCQTFEATDFLISGRHVDTSCSLILWQIGVIGVMTYEHENYEPKNLEVLVEYLSGYYGDEHEVIVYESSMYPLFDSEAQTVALRDLAKARVSPISTLYVPPKNERHGYDPHMLERLGMDEAAIHSIEMKIYAQRTRRDYVFTEDPTA
jgi:precorrin-3B methylase